MIQEKSKRRRKIDMAVLTIVLIMFCTLIAFFYFVQHSRVKSDPKYREVKAAVGPQFDKIVKYIEYLDRSSSGTGCASKKEMQEAASRKEGQFRFSLANMGSYNGEIAYCLVAENVVNKGRAYHSSVIVNDPTWDGKRSYHHYVTGKEPAPDLGGPCNEQVIRR